IDYIIENYVFKIIFLNKSVIIINRQIELKQIWLATKINGYRFDYKSNQWICSRSNQNFWKIFHDSCCLQSHTDLP
ncbi:MAG: iron donor protein CyaY, partial [Buchnera aphidicola]|nr:iron donor protein CyaY [Buchnera aphidicola]